MDKKAKTNKNTNNKNQNKVIHKKAASIPSNKKKVTTTTKTIQKEKEKEKVNDVKPSGTNVSKQNNNNNNNINNIDNEVHSPHTKHVMFNEKVLNPNEHVLDVFCKISNPFQKGVHKMKKCIKIHMNFQNDENIHDNDLNTPENDIELFNDDNHKHLEKEILKLNEHDDDEFEIDHTFSDESKSLTTKDNKNKNTNVNGINNKNITKKTILKNKNFNINNDNKRKTSAKKLIAKDSFRKSSNTNIKGKNLKHSSKKLTQPLKNNNKHLPQKAKVISHNSHNNNNNDNHHTRRIISNRDKLSLHSSLDSSIEDNLYTRLLKEDFDEDGGIRKIISLMKPHKSEMDLNFKTKQALELVNNKKNFNFDYNSAKKGNYRNSLNISNESLIKENNNSLIRTPIRKKLSGMTLANTKLTTAYTNNKKFYYDKNGNEIILNKIPIENIENVSVETHEFYIMEDDKGNVVKAQKRVSRKDNGNEIIEYIDENGNVVDINKYTIIDKAIQHVSPKLLDGLFNENNNCDVYEVLDNEGKIIQVRKVFKSTKKNNNKELFESNDNVEYIDLNGNVIQVKKVIKQIKPPILDNKNSNGGIKNGKELENAINNVKPDFANNNERNNFETPKTKQNYNHNSAKNDLTNSNNAPNTSRNKYISNSISSCFIKPYTSIRDKHSSTGKKSRNKNNEVNMFSEKQKRLFFRNGSLPFLGSYNKASVNNFISSPEDIIIPSVEHDPKDKFYISSRKAQIIHPPNTMKISSFGFFK